MNTQKLKKSKFRTAAKLLIERKEDCCCFAIDPEAYVRNLWNAETIAFRNVFGLAWYDSFDQMAANSSLFADRYSDEMLDFRLWALAMAEAVLFYEET